MLNGDWVNPHRRLAARARELTFVSRMGSTGHAFIAHTKALSPRAQVRVGGELPPHPLAVRPGQRFWPRHAKQRRPFVVRRVDGGRAAGDRLDGQGERVTSSVSSLLATRADGQGRYFQFQGFVSRVYMTYAWVVEVGESQAILCLPEWHPQAPVTLFASLVPEAARHPGAWLRLSCDLSAAYPARLAPRDLVPAEDPGPDLIHRPAVL